MLTIGDRTMKAFAEADARRERLEFGNWWRALSPELPSLSQRDLDLLWSRAVEQGLELGLIDDGKRRLSLLAAATALHAGMDGAMLLRLIDIVFENRSDRARLRAIREAGQAPGPGIA